MAIKNLYLPISLDEAVMRSAHVLEIFRNAGVDVIRIGLCASDNLSDPDSYYAGPNHPALGELVENEFYYRKIAIGLRDIVIPSNARVIITVSPGSISKAIGQNKKNKLRLMTDFKIAEILFKENTSCSEFEIKIKCEERKN